MIATRRFELRLRTTALIAVACATASTIATAAHAGMPSSYAPRLAAAYHVALAHPDTPQLRAVRAEGRVVARHGVGTRQRLRTASVPLPAGHPPDPIAHRFDDPSSTVASAQLRTHSNLRHLSHAPAIGSASRRSRAEVVASRAIAPVRAYAVADRGVVRAHAPPTSL